MVLGGNKIVSKIKSKQVFFLVFFLNIVEIQNFYVAVFLKRKIAKLSIFFCVGGGEGKKF